MTLADSRGIGDLSLHPWWARLADPALEHRYRQHYLLPQRRLTIGVILVTLLPHLVFFHSDSVLVASAQAKNGLEWLRFCHVALGLTAVGFIATRRRTHPMDLAALLYCLATTAMGAVVLLTRPSDYYGHLFIDLVVVLVFYFILPNCFVFQLLAGLGYSLMVLGIGLLARDLQGPTLASFVLSLALINGFGILVSRHLHLERRRSFAGQFQEQQLRLALQAALEEQRRLGAHLEGQRVAAEDRGRLLQALYQGIQVPISIIDVAADGELRLGGINPAQGAISGLGPGDVGRPLRHLSTLSAEAASQMETNYRRCLTLGQSIDYEETITFSGRQTHWLTRLSPLGTEDGRIDRLVGTSVEITALKTVERSLVEAKEAAEAKNHARSALLARLGHELRTPLNTILGFAQVIEQQDSRGTLGYYTQIIRRSGEHLLLVINDVLHMAHLDNAEAPLGHQAFCLRQLLQDLAALYQPSAKARGLTFILDTRGEWPTPLYGDGAKLRQVLINLLDNALQMTERGEVVLRVRHLPRGLGGQVRVAFAVADNGPGIAPGEQRSIFEAFVQGKGNTRGGMGLGLAISREYVALMGGKLRVRSALGRGAVFAFQLTFASHPQGAEGAHPSEPLPQALDPQDIPPRVAALPADLRLGLVDAAQTLDARRVEDLLAHIATLDAPLAATLQVPARQFQFDVVVAYLDGRDGGGGG